MASRDAPSEVPGTDRRPAKRARTQRHAPPASGAPLWRDWANLTAGPAALIADHVLANNVADYIRFRAACTAWRVLCPDPRAHQISDRRFHPRQWIMLPSNFNVDRRRRFVNLSTGECIHVGIPDLRRHYLFGPTAEGFLVLCRMGTTHIVHLLNPITGQVTELPCAATLFDPSFTRSWRTAHGARNLVLHSAGVTNDSAVVLLYNLLESQFAAVAKPGQKSWARLNLGQHRIMSALPLAGRMYCVTNKNILVVETSSANNEQEEPRLVTVSQMKGTFSFSDQPAVGLRDNYVYPIVLDGRDVILVHRQLYRCLSVTAGDYTKERYTTYRVELETGNMDLVHGLGGQALFVCWNRSQSVPAKFFSSSIGADTIYICSNYRDENGPKVIAFDLLSGNFFETKFDNKDIARYLSSYVCS